MNSTPLVSIIIPCYQQGRFLEETLQSVLNQTYPHWECLIINDGSTDNTEKIADSWIKKDIRFYYHYKENGGLSTARNKGLDNAKGSYIQFLDADDFLVNTKIEDSLELVEEMKLTLPQIIISNFRMFRNSHRRTFPAYCNLVSELFTLENILQKWDKRFSIPIHCGLFHSKLFLEFRFPETLNAKEDWVMWIRLFKEKPGVHFIDKPLALYRKNHEGMTMTKNLYLEHIKAYKYLKQYLSQEEYELLALSLIELNYERADYYKIQLLSLQNKKYVRFGIVIRKMFRKMGILKPFHNVLP